MNIAIIDYGMGNLRSVQKGLERVGFPAEVTRESARIEAADGVVLPGVGAFRACMDNLREYGLIDTVRNVVDAGKPFLGICLGMQLLFEESEEFGRVEGLGILPGRVVRFADRPGLKVPHMGWNQIKKAQAVPHLNGIEDGVSVYFVHSYHVVPDDPSLAATTTEYGIEFVSAVARGNIFATQYHPEKSQAVGLKILENFGTLVRASGQALKPPSPQAPGGAAGQRGS